MDEFLRRMGELFECVLFTASLAKVPRGRREGKTRVGVAGRDVWLVGDVWWGSWSSSSYHEMPLGEPGLYPNKSCPLPASMLTL